jgi:membrane-associated protease RseP (regulator of RpoE activity)
MSALVTLGFAASLTVIAPPERCVPSPPQRQILVEATGRVDVGYVLMTLSQETCEMFVVPSWLANRTVYLEGGVTPRTVKATRRWLLSTLESQGVHVKADKVLRVSGDDHAGSTEPATVQSMVPGSDAVTDGDDLDHEIHCDGNRCEIARALLDRLLANTTVLATSARFVPSIKDGKPNGFKLYAIRPSSIFGKIGLQNGDTITAVNGLDMTTPDHALEAYTKLRNAKHLTISVERRGENLTFDYEIRG